VVGIDHVPELVARSRAALHRIPHCAALLASGALRVVEGDGYQGYPLRPGDGESLSTGAGAAGNANGPGGGGGDQRSDGLASLGYDVIHVGAAAPAIPPRLVEQLAVGGLLLLPVGADGGDQEYVVVEKVDAAGRVRTRTEMGVRFIPLTSKVR
jgi:protein-L-isoaspartate(D-aspartate) O-methyltransferase